MKTTKIILLELIGVLHIKDFYTFTKDYGVKPLTYVTGCVTLTLFGMTLFQSLSFIPKMITMFLILPWVLGH